MQSTSATISSAAGVQQECSTGRFSPQCLGASVPHTVTQSHSTRNDAAGQHSVVGGDTTATGYWYLPVASPNPTVPQPRRRVVVPFSVLHRPVRKYKLTSEGRHSLRLARLAIGRAVPSPAPRPGGVIRSLWWRSGARLLLPRPRPRPVDHSSSAAVLVRVMFSLSSLLACWPAAANRPHGQAASNSQQQPATASNSQTHQHQPASSLLVNLTAALARCCTSNHNLQATAGQGHGHRPSPHRPSCQTAARAPPPRTVDERPSNSGREPAQEGWKSEGRHKGTKAQHKSKHRGAASSSVELDPILSAEGC
jgi:hypothetical protein